jgi:hypothetical protein
MRVSTSYDEKTEFPDHLIEQAKKKFAEQFSRIQMTHEERNQLYDFDYSNITSLRDIKRQFNNHLMDFLVQKDYKIIYDV